MCCFQVCLGLGVSWVILLGWIPVINVFWFCFLFIINLFWEQCNFWNEWLVMHNVCWVKFYVQLDGEPIYVWCFRLLVIIFIASLSHKFTMWLAFSNILFVLPFFSNFFYHKHLLCRCHVCIYIYIYKSFVVLWLIMSGWYDNVGQVLIYILNFKSHY